MVPQIILPTALKAILWDGVKMDLVELLLREKRLAVEIERIMKRLKLPYMGARIFVLIIACVTRMPRLL